MENKKDFPFSLYNRDLLSLYNILYLAKGEAKKKTIGETYKEVCAEMEKRLNAAADNGEIRLLKVFVIPAEKIYTINGQKYASEKPVIIELSKITKIADNSEYLTVETRDCAADCCGRTIMYLKCQINDLFDYLERRP